MSIYSYIYCDTCKVALHVADPDVEYFHAQPKEMLDFLETHRTFKHRDKQADHVLRYSWEDDFEEFLPPGYWKAIRTLADNWDNPAKPSGRKGR